MQSSHQPQLLRQLREKSLTLTLSIQKLNNTKKSDAKTLQSLQQQFQRLKSQKQVQQRKNKSLYVLLNELQQSYYDTYLESKSNKDIDEVVLGLENSFLRSLLIKQADNNKDSQQLLTFMKQLQLDKNKNRAKEFIKKSNFIEHQSQIIAKLKSQTNLLKNSNLQCKRKWYNLQEEIRSVESLNKLLSIQNQRQKTNMKKQYEEYLERIDESKMKIVNFNELQKESIITDYLVKEIAVVQQRRVEVEEENSNLKYHYENLKEELSKVEIQNRELRGFFGEGNQEGDLASKMRKRIDELRDALIEARNGNKSNRRDKLSKILENSRKQYKNLLESNDLMEIRIQNQQSEGAHLQEKPIAEFFGKILQAKDKAIILLREEENSLKDKKKQYEIRKQVLESQISNMEQNLDMNGWQNSFNEQQTWNYAKQAHYQMQKPQNSGPIEGTDWSRSRKRTAGQAERNYQL